MPTPIEAVFSDVVTNVTGISTDVLTVIAGSVSLSIIVLGIGFLRSVLSPSVQVAKGCKSSDEDKHENKLTGGLS